MFEKVDRNKVKNVATVVAIVLTALIVFASFILMLSYWMQWDIATRDPLESYRVDRAAFAKSCGCDYVTMVESRYGSSHTYMMGETADGQEVFMYCETFEDDDNKTVDWQFDYSLTEIAERMTANGVPCRKQLLEVNNENTRSNDKIDFNRFTVIASQEMKERYMLFYLFDDVFKSSDVDFYLRYTTPDVPDFDFFVVQSGGSLRLYYKGRYSAKNLWSMPI